MGIASIFTPIGLAAGLTGSLFGSVLSNPWVIWAIAGVFLALSASMFGAFEFVLPSALTNRLALVGGIGYGGAFALGLVSGVIAAPCTGPVLTGILLWIGKTKSAGLGAGVLFAFSIGLGVPFWLVGTFAVHLPKAGRWMLGVKSFFGVVLAAAALYFLKNAVRPLAHLARPTDSFLFVSLGLVVFGVALGAIHLTFADTSRWMQFRKGAGILGAVAGLFLFVSWVELPRAHLEWEISERAARERALAETKPVLIDFTAEWCGACGELARNTFADPSVMAEASRFVTLKVDATQEEDPLVDHVKDKYGVLGLPTVILLGKNGDERLRFTEFVPPPGFSRLFAPSTRQNVPSKEAHACHSPLIIKALASKERSGRSPRSVSRPCAFRLRARPRWRQVRQRPRATSSKSRHRMDTRPVPRERSK